MAYPEVYNNKCPAVKRLMKEAAEMKDPTEDYSANPVNDNLFEWHFTIRGSSDSDFKEGIYHGRIIFPNEYPMKPPNIMLYTPNGRFETNKKICLSISGHHPETWQPSWSVRTALLALIAFMPTSSGGTIGSLDYPSDERQMLARKSQIWDCPECGNIKELLVSKLDSNSSTVENVNIPDSVEKVNIPDSVEKVNDIHDEENKLLPVDNTSIKEEETVPNISASGFQGTCKNTAVAQTSHTAPTFSIRTSLLNHVYDMAAGIIIGIICFLIYRRIYLT